MAMVKKVRFAFRIPALDLMAKMYSCIEEVPNCDIHDLVGFKALLLKGEIIFLFVGINISNLYLLIVIGGENISGN